MMAYNMAKEYVLLSFISFGLLHKVLCQGGMPLIRNGPRDIEIERGQPLKLPCTVIGYPKPRVTWYKNGNMLSYTSKLRLLEDNGLYFEKVRKSSRRSDEGTYWCVATNDNGETRSRNATLTIIYISRRFKLDPQNVDISRLGFVQLDCQPPDAFPKPIVTWKKNSQIVQTDDRIRLQSFGYVYHLRISKALQQDAGNYTCIAYNRAGQRTSRPAHLRVLVPPSVSVATTGIVVYEEETADLSCQTSGVPQPSVSWYKSKEELPLSRLRKISPNRIQIVRTKLSDAGVFVCRAMNSEGITEKNVTLSVKMLPRFLTRPANLKVGIGQDARFDCKVQAEPGYKIIWQRINRAQSAVFVKGQTEKRITIFDDGRLQIKNVQKNDEASYVCTVISGDKTESASARLSVVYTSVPLPEVNIFPLNRTIVEGNDFNLTCIAKGNPVPTVTWHSASSNTEITEGTEGIIQQSNGFVHSLLFKLVRPSDSGSYRCTASNSGRTVSKVAYLTVTPIPRIPDPPDYVDYNNVTATTLVLKWKASRNPAGAPVTSYVISIYDTKGHVWKALASDIKQLQYTVRNLSPGSNYEFRVSAVNKVGRSNPSRATPSIRTKSRNGVKTTKMPVTLGTPKYVDKLLDVSLTVTTSSSSRIDSFNVLWTPVYPASRVKGYEIFWKKKSATDFESPKAVYDGSINSYVLENLEPGTPYEVKVRAFNDRYGSSFSNVKAFSTMTKQEVFIPPPSNVRLKVNDTGKVLVTWSASKIKGLSGYEIVWIAFDATSVETKTVPPNVTSFMIGGLNPDKWYHVTLALKVENRAGLKSDKLKIQPRLAGINSNKNGGASGTGNNNADGTSGKRANDDGTGVAAKENEDSDLIKLLKTPWFIGAVGGFIWLAICIIVLVIVLRRRKRKRHTPAFHAEQANGLLPTRSPMNSINRNRANYRDSSFLWGDMDPSQQGGPEPPPSYKAVAPTNPSIMEETSSKVESKPLLGNRAAEYIEMKPKTANGDLYKNNKNANNLRRPGDVGSISSGNKESFLNNLKKDRSLDRYTASPKMNLNRNVEGSLDRPRFKIQGALLDGQQPPGPADEKEENSETAKQNNMLERHAEIVRTSNKKFDSDLVNCLENNPQATWKREKMKDAPEVLTSGEDTLRRKAKAFKPMPKLEVLNWADYPTTPSKPGSCAGSPPSSPKASTSMFSDNNGSRATSRASQGSMSSLNKYPYGGRSGHAPSVSSRRMSQSSSMVSSELYQSEMDPSVYSDATSEKKKPKAKAVPPPIDLDGLTSDILLQWAESVTNSSPSSSGSSSPSRLSAISSDGSFLTDEDFAQAVAAVVECGGFMDFDYSLSNMPGLQVAPQSRPTPTDRHHKMKMEKIDAMIASKGKSRHGPGSSISQQHRSRQDTCSPPSMPPISFSSYLTGNSKRNGGNSLSNVPQASSNRQRANNHSAASDSHSTRFGNVDAETFLSTPLTMSNLRQHDSSLGREKKHSKPLTASNLRQHDSSLDRQKKPTVGSLAAQDDDVFDGMANGNAMNGAVAQPLSVISALERNESLGSTKDSKSSISSEVETRGTSERRKDKKFVVNLKDPTSSTGTSTASTVRTSQDQTEC